MLGQSPITTENVLEAVNAKEGGLTKAKRRRISRFMDKILDIKEGKRKVRTEEDFEELFFEMEWVVNNV